jgi:hypothetical protein
MTTTTMRALLYSALAILVVWRAAVVEHPPSRFGLQATIDAAHVELTLTLPLLCLQVRAHFVDELLAVSATPLCSHCSTTGRSWS